MLFQSLIFTFLFVNVIAIKPYSVSNDGIVLVGPGSFNITHSGNKLKIVITNHGHISSKYLLCVGPTATKDDSFCPAGYGLIEFFYNMDDEKIEYTLNHQGKLQNSKGGHYNAPIIATPYMSIHVPYAPVGVTIALKNAKIYRPDVSKHTIAIIMFSLECGFILSFIIFLIASVANFHFSK